MIGGMPGNEIGVVTCCCTCGYVEYVCIDGAFDVNVTLSFVGAYGCCCCCCICCWWCVNSGRPKITKQFNKRKEKKWWWHHCYYTCGSWEYCCCCGVVAVLGSNTESKPGKLAIDDGGGTFANWLNVGTAPVQSKDKSVSCNHCFTRSR